MASQTADHVSGVYRLHLLPTRNGLELVRRDLYRNAQTFHAHRSSGYVHVYSSPTRNPRKAEFNILPDRNEIVRLDQNAAIGKIDCLANALLHYRIPLQDPVPKSGFYRIAKIRTPIDNTHILTPVDDFCIVVRNLELRTTLLRFPFPRVLLSLDSLDRLLSHRRLDPLVQASFPINPSCDLMRHLRICAFLTHRFYPRAQMQFVRHNPGNGLQSLCLDCSRAGPNFGLPCVDSISTGQLYLGALFEAMLGKAG
jgi:hypothetical protein